VLEEFKNLSVDSCVNVAVSYSGEVDIFGILQLAFDVDNQPPCSARCMLAGIVLTSSCTPESMLV
jgi:hypothetical protein